jgi:hypothetical protein
MLVRTTAESTADSGVRYATSGNWGGYVADVLTTPYWVDGAFGTFYAQLVCSTCNNLASWVGVGGWNGNYIAQAGFDERLDRAWYELWPNAPVYLNIYPAAGNALYVDVHYDLSTAKWYILFDDASTGQYWSNEFSFNVDQNSAEWILELAAGTTVPVSNSVQFSGSQWEDEYSRLQNVDSSESVPTPVTLTASGCGSVTPGTLSGGQNFLDVVSGC